MIRDSVRAIFASALLFVCVFSIGCSPADVRPSDPQQDVSSIDDLQGMLVGTWKWQKPAESTVTFDVYYTFSSDGSCRIGRSPDDSTAMRTVYEVNRERSRWNGRQVNVIRIKNQEAWELLRISNDMFEVRHGGIDATFVDRYLRVE
jgi:hypothetical protein